MITKILKVYIPYLYMQVKYESVTLYIKNKNRGGIYIIVSKGTFCFKGNQNLLNWILNWILQILLYHCSKQQYSVKF